MLRRTALLFFIAAFLCLALSPVSIAISPSDYSVSNPGNLVAGHLYGESAICIDADSAGVLFAKDAYSRRYPASTTKIMTCILAIENGPVGEMVNIPVEATQVPQDSSKLGIAAGEIMSFDDLLYGLMLKSGNDAAVAAAILTSGSEAEFVKLMNRKAAEIGCIGTHFDNAHGYHNVNHYSTAYDLALIARYAMQNDMFREIAATYLYTMNATNVHAETLISSEYQLLDPDATYYYEPCIGIKSGRTRAAGRCFVGAGTKDGLNVISVTLFADSSDDKYIFIDTIRLLKYGFLQFQKVTFDELYAMCDDSLLALHADNAIADDAQGGYLRPAVTNLTAPDYYEYYLTKSVDNDADQIARDFASRLEYRLLGVPTAPIRQGDVLGTVVYTSKNGATVEGTLIASRDVAQEPPTFQEIMDEWLNANAPMLKPFIPRYNPAIWLLYALIPIAIVFLCIRRARRIARINRRRKALFSQRQQAYLHKQARREELLRQKGRAPSPRPRRPDGR